MSTSPCGIGIIYGAHQLDEVFRIADRVTVLRDWRRIGTMKLHETSPGDLAGWINRARRLAKDFEAIIESALAWLLIALAFLFTRRLARLSGQAT
jgi:ABC-type sugar transport system ATPase subunit